MTICCTGRQGPHTAGCVPALRSSEVPRDGPWKAQTSSQRLTCHTGPAEALLPLFCTAREAPAAQSTSKGVSKELGEGGKWNRLA